MVWQSGESGNPAGRPRKYLGPNPRSQEYRESQYQEIRNAAEAQDLVDPLEFQHQKMMDESLPIGLRCSLATAITPFYHPKLGIASVARYIETPIEVPDFQTIEQAEVFLASLAQRFASSELGSQSALDLSTLVRNWISAKHQAMELEIKRLNADASTGEQVIRIEGGLPTLPGTNIIMPDQHPSTAMPIDSSPEPDVLSPPAQEPAEPAE